MERKKTNSRKKSSANAVSSILVKAKSGKARRKRLSELEKRVRQIVRWHKRLAPQFPDIDPHDLHLIIESLLRTRKERMEVMLLKRRKDGFYVF